MNEDLSALVQAAALDETRAAEREFPHSSATLTRYLSDVRRRRSAGAAMLAVAGVVVVGIAALGIDQLWHGGPQTVFPVPLASTPVASASSVPSATAGPTATATASQTATATATGDPTAPAPTTAEPSTAPPPDPTSTSPPKTTTPPPSETAPVPAPGQITVIKGWAGGGSGEISVTWQQIPDATGYRVYRSESPDGPFAASAWLDVTTGATTIEFPRDYEFITMASLVAVDGWDFAYTESTYAVGPIYFRVTGFDAGGEGPPSPVVCGTPPGGPSC